MKRTLLLLSSVVVSILISVALLSTLKSASANDQTAKTTFPSINEKLAASLPLTSSEPFELLGQVGGQINHVAVSGTYAYVNIDRRLAVLDVSNPAAVALLDQSNVFSSEIGDIDVYSQHLFISTADGLHAFDLTNPRLPQKIAVFPWSVRTIKTEFLGNRAYYVEDSGLKSIDLSQLSELQSSNDPQAVSETAIDFAISDEHICVLSYSPHADTSAAQVSGGGTNVLRCDNSATLQGGTLGYFLIHGSTLINSYGTLTIRDIVTLQPISLLDYIPDDAGIWETFLTQRENFLYTGALSYKDNESRGEPWFLITDVGDPTHPIVRGSLGLPNIRDEIPSINRPRYPSDSVALAGDFAYVADGNLRIINIADPDSPTLNGTYDANKIALAASKFVIAQNGLAYTAGDKFMMVKATIPTSPAVTSVYSPLGSATSLAISGTTAYLNLANQAGEKWLRILDISNSTKASQLGDLFPSAANDSQVVGNFLYTVDEQGLNIIDVSQPLIPTLASSIATPSAKSLAVIGNHAYLALTDGNMLIVDLSNRTLSSGGLISATEIAQYIDKLIITTPGTIRIFDVTNPLQPTEITNYCGSDFSNVIVDGDFLFALNNGAIEVFALNDPNLRMPIASYGDNIVLFTVNDGTLYVMRDNTMQILKWHVPQKLAPAPQAISIPDSFWDVYGVAHWPMVNADVSFTAVITPNLSFPLTFTWQTDEQQLTQTVNAPLNQCARTVTTSVDSLGWSHAGLKTVTFTVESSAGAMSTTKDLFVNNYVPFTITPESNGVWPICQRLYTPVWEETCEVLKFHAAIGTVTETVEIQYSPFFTLPHLFDPTTVSEPNVQQIEPLLGQSEPADSQFAVRPFKVEVIGDPQATQDFAFIRPLTVRRMIHANSHFYEDQLHLRRWDGEKWAHEADIAQTGNDSTSLCDFCPLLQFEIKQTGEYAIFGEVRQVNNHSYLPLITRN